MTYDIVIIGGGAAGIATAASILKRNAKVSIAVVDAARDHYYQPGWTLVGAGVFTPEQTRKAEADVMPKGVEWIRLPAITIDPERQAITLGDGDTIAYRVLIVAPGLRLAWEKIAGLTEALGRNGVTSNYRYDLAPYTYQLVQELQRGRALFSQPPAASALERPSRIASIAAAPRSPATGEKPPCHTARMDSGAPV